MAVSKIEFQVLTAFWAFSPLDVIQRQNPRGDDAVNPGIIRRRLCGEQLWRSLLVRAKFACPSAPSRPFHHATNC
jgi:hypothetical protein